MNSFQKFQKTQQKKIICKIARKFKIFLIKKKNKKFKIFLICNKKVRIIYKKLKKIKKKYIHKITYNKIKIKLNLKNQNKKINKIRYNNNKYYQKNKLNQKKKLLKTLQKLNKIKIKKFKMKKVLINKKMNKL